MMSPDPKGPSPERKTISHQGESWVPFSELVEARRERDALGEALQGRMEQLTFDHQKHMGRLTALNDSLLAERDEAREQLEAAREALRPFAALADSADKLRHGPGSSCPWRLQYNDLARARSALESGK